MSKFRNLSLPHAPNLSLPTPDSFLIPKTDLTLRLHQFGPRLNPTILNSLFLEARNDIHRRIDQKGADAASSEQRYSYTSDEGLALEIWSRPTSLKGYESSDELCNIISGLSLYMVQENRARATRFQVIQNLGATKAVIRNMGSIRQDVASSITGSKRAFPPSPLMQYSSTSSVTGAVNTSALSRQTADDFPIPHSDFTLLFEFPGDFLHPWDLETLFIAVIAAIDAEIAAHGRIARLPSTEYSMSLAGLQFWIQRMPWDTVNLAWAELAIFVTGLWAYIIKGGHHRESFVDVINHVTGRQVAWGWFGKHRGPLELTSSTRAAKRSLEALASRQIS